MSGLRVFIHDAHGHHVNGDVRFRRASEPRMCEGYGEPRHMILAGAWYGTATQWPSDPDYSWVKADTLRPSTRPFRMRLCLRCLGDGYEDVLAAFEMDVS